MTRWVLLGGAVVILSLAATLAVQWLPAATTTGPIPGAPKSESGPRGVATVEEGLVHEFGTMAQETVGAHTWTLKNTGQGDLKLTVGNASCSCTIANIEKDKSKVLAPGDETEIRLGWSTKDRNGKFHQYAQIITSDPEKPIIQFEIDGEIRPAILVTTLDGLSGEALYFANASNNEAHTLSLAVFSVDRPEMIIEEATVVRKDRFDVEIKPLDDEQREKLHVHAGGHQLVVTLKPGAVLGDFKDELTIKTDHPAMKVKKVPVGGKVTGPISFMPANCKMTVDSKQGATKEVRITVRNQAETEWTITAPKGLETEVRATEQINKAADGSVRMRTYVLTVTVPAGAKSGLIRGDIVLQTNHPLAREVRLPLDITIIGG